MNQQSTPLPLDIHEAIELSSELLEPPSERQNLAVNDVGGNLDRRTWLSNHVSMRRSEVPRY